MTKVKGCVGWNESIFVFQFAEMLLLIWKKVSDGLTTIHQLISMALQKNTKGNDRSRVYSTVAYSHTTGLYYALAAFVCLFLVPLKLFLDEHCFTNVCCLLSFLHMACMWRQCIVEQVSHGRRPRYVTNDQPELTQSLQVLSWSLSEVAWSTSLVCCLQYNDYSLTHQSPYLGAYSLPTHLSSVTNDQPVLTQ